MRKKDGVEEGGKEARKGEREESHKCREGRRKREGGRTLPVFLYIILTKLSS